MFLFLIRHLFAVSPSLLIVVFPRGTSGLCCSGPCVDGGAENAGSSAAASEQGHPLQVLCCVLEVADRFLKLDEEGGIRRDDKEGGILSGNEDLCDGTGLGLIVRTG